jgi:hypothetical protein
MPVIVGSPRSGTTLLRFMLDAHPDLAIPPETGFLALADQLTGEDGRLRAEFFEALRRFPAEAPAWEDFGLADGEFWAVLLAIEPFTVTEGFRAFYRTYAARFNKGRWGDKTPMHCLHLPVIAAVLPEAHVIHVIRDGRDVALSLRDLWFSPGRSMEAQAEQWRRCVTTARADAASCRQYMEVRFEDLVSEPERVLKAVCAFVGLSWAADMLDYHVRTPERLREHRDRRHAAGGLLVSQAQRLRQQALVTCPPQAARVQAWRREMSAGDRARFEAIAGDLLLELGYELSERPVGSTQPTAV